MLAWFALSSAMTFIAFGWDKWRAGRAGRRVPEFYLALLGAVGGWPGGWLGMKLFRHKTIKKSFQLKYAVGLAFFAVEVWAWLRWR